MNVQRERRIEWSRKSDSKLPGAERKFCISRSSNLSQIPVTLIRIRAAVYPNAGDWRAPRRTRALRSS